MTVVREDARRRSGSWALGLLSASGPVLLLAANIPAQSGPPLIPWVSILLDLWCAASIVLGVAAIVVARRDWGARAAERTRFAAHGMALGILTLVADACILLLWLFSPLSF